MTNNSDIEKQGIHYADILRSRTKIPANFKFSGYAIQNCLTDEFLVAASMQTPDTPDFSCCIWTSSPEMACVFDSFGDVIQLFFDMSDCHYDVNVVFLFESDKRFMVSGFEEKPQRGS
ncbi:hypothetical protein H8526_005501 [Salmonella enterica]|nr:hypothetical protein [Salmonella enterica]EKS7701380.1 hypothetical protein [Salmonella enterica]